MGDHGPAAWEVYADVVIQRAALLARVRRGEPPRPLAGLVVDDAEIALLLGELPGLSSPDAAEIEAVERATRDELERSELALAHSEANDLFGIVAANAWLDDVSKRVFAIAVAVEIDPARQRLVSYLNDDVSRRWLTPAVLLRLIGEEAMAALGRDAPLIRSCLVELAGETTWALQAVRVGDSIAAALAGAPGSDAALPRSADIVEAEGAHGDDLVLVHGADAAARIERAAAATAGSRFLKTRLPSDDAEWVAIARQAVLGGFSLIIDIGSSNELSEDTLWWVDRISHLSIAICSRSEIKLDAAPNRPFREHQAERVLRDVGAGHLLDAEQARLTNKALASVDGVVDAAIRRLVTGNLDAHAVRTRPGRSWDELVLPKHHVRVLHELVSRYQHRHRVFDEWGFPKRPSTGVTTLFAGASGTGKTMTAEVIATELGLDLYRIDLAAVVSKYIGETEKNLEDIFTASEAGNLVLFFDEADALFGKRSDVSDAHDRYANIEVAYLLQRVERYDGFVVLATNLRNNIDNAFLRRIDVALDFEMPDVEQRTEIWKRVFPKGAPVGDIDHALLASEFEISGGVIRNAAVHAAFVAADEGCTIEMEQVVVGVEREFQKMGRLRPAAAFASRRSNDSERANAASA